MSSVHVVKSGSGSVLKVRTGEDSLDKVFYEEDSVAGMQKCIFHLETAKARLAKPYTEWEHMSIHRLKLGCSEADAVCLFDHEDMEDALHGRLVHGNVCWKKGWTFPTTEELYTKTRKNEL